MGDSSVLQQIQERIKGLQAIVGEIGTEHPKAQGTISKINKIHEKARETDKISHANKAKLKNLYDAAEVEAEAEETLVRKALEKIYEIRNIKNERKIQAKHSGNKETVRRGTLMKILHTSAQVLPLWIGKIGENPPPLCGSVPADGNYVAKMGDIVAALVRGSEGEENWILAEVIRYNAQASKYELEDVDEEQKEVLTLARKHVVPLPLMRANPQSNPEALYPKDVTVLALYPQTTCFYKAVVTVPPQSHNDEYEVQFEDTSYAEGYSPPLKVAQRYVIPIILNVKDKKSK